MQLMYIKAAGNIYVYRMLSARKVRNIYTNKK